MNELFANLRVAELSREELVARQARLLELRHTNHSGCLLCDRRNEVGLQLDFSVHQDGAVCAAFLCRDSLRSYAQTLHGGVISAVLDAAMTNALFSRGVVAVTAELVVRFLLPVSLNETAVVRAYVEKDWAPVYSLRAELWQSKKLKARASAKFFQSEST